MQILVKGDDVKSGTVHGALWPVTGGTGVDGLTPIVKTKIPIGLPIHFLKIHVA